MMNNGDRKTLWTRFYVNICFHFRVNTQKWDRWVRELLCLLWGTARWVSKLAEPSSFPVFPTLIYRFNTTPLEAAGV